MIGIKVSAVELGRVMEKSGKPVGAHIAANSLHDAGRRQSFAKHRLGQLPAARRNHVGLRGQLGTERRELLGSVGGRAANAAEIQGVHNQPLEFHPAAWRACGSIFLR